MVWRLGCLIFSFLILTWKWYEPGTIVEWQFIPIYPWYSAISEIPCIYLPGSLWPILGVLYFYHGIHQRAVWTFGPCSPRICEETVIQTELWKLVLRNKEQLRQNVKDETILATFCEIPQCFNWSLRGTSSCETLDYICEKPRKVQRPTFKKDPSSLIKCVTATGTLVKHSYWKH